MLKKVYRLRKRLEFKRAYKRGKSVKNRCFVLYYSPNILGEARIGFSVSKKIGKAVVRNKVKRRLRAACNQVIDSFTKGYDYIIIARNPILGASVQSLEQQLKSKLGEINLTPRYKKKNK